MLKEIYFLIEYYLETCGSIKDLPHFITIKKNQGMFLT